MIIFATLVCFIAIYLMQDNGYLTQNKVKQAIYISLFIISGILYSMQYGTLRGIFILLGVASLIGMAFTFLHYKWQQQKQ